MSARRGHFERLRWWAPAFLVAGVAWWACGLSIASYRDREKQDREAIASLHGQIDRAATPIGEIRKLETAAEAFRAQIDRIEQELPGPSVSDSMPDELKKHFARFGLNVSSSQFTMGEEVAALPGYSHGSWSVVVPLLENDPRAAEALLAVAEFEEQHPFVKVVNLVIRPDVEDPRRRVAALNLTALFRK